MNEAQNNPRAVLTGDIINSSTLNQQERQGLFDTFPRLSALLRDRYPNEIHTSISNFRGDGWQLVVDHPPKALEISLFVRTYIRFTITQKKIDSRIAIGIGGVDFIPEGNVSAGYGSAYTVSGHLLEALGAHERMALGFSMDQLSIAHGAAVMLVELLDDIISAWGTSQCQAVFWALQGLTQTQIAERWLPAPITQPSVSNNLSRSSWSRITKSLVFFEELMNHLQS